MLLSPTTGQAWASLIHAPATVLGQADDLPAPLFDDLGRLAGLR